MSVVVLGYGVYCSKTDPLKKLRLSRFTIENYRTLIADDLRIFNYELSYLDDTFYPMWF